MRSRTAAPLDAAYANRSVIRPPHILNAGQVAYRPATADGEVSVPARCSHLLGRLTAELSTARQLRRRSQLANYALLANSTGSRDVPRMPQPYPQPH
jgi:hypothetical protein